MNRTLIGQRRKIVIHGIPSSVHLGRETMSMKSALLIELYMKNLKTDLNIHHVQFVEIEKQYNMLSMKQLLQAT